MAKKRSSRVATKRKTKKKSWWSFFFVLAIATVIGLPISYNMTKSSSQVASTGTSKIAGGAPSIYVKSITADAGICAGKIILGAKTDSTQKVAAAITTPYPIQPAFETVRFTCTNGKTGGLNYNGGCVDLSTAAQKAQEACGSLGGTTPTPTPPVTMYLTRTPTPTISINYPVTPTTSGVACSGASPSGKILICFISTCASKNLKTYAPANSYCTGLGKTNCCEY